MDFLIVLFMLALLIVLVLFSLIILSTVFEIFITHAIYWRYFKRYTPPISMKPLTVDELKKLFENINWKC